jgi:hypothetical protein
MSKLSKMNKILPGNLIQYDNANIFYIVVNIIEQYMYVIRLEISDNFDATIRYTGYSSTMSYIVILK